MSVIGYGEDALTFWALSTEWDSLANELKINKVPDEEIVRLYRPSFGRGKYGFGEFDAIISTDKVIFLIESKWENSSEVTSKGIKLTLPQQNRHKVFHELHKKWKSVGDWDGYFQDLKGTKLEKWKVCDSKCDLAKNIKSILKLIDPQKKKNIKNIVLLVLHPDAEDVDLTLESDIEFEKITIGYKPNVNIDGKFFAIQNSTRP